MSFYICGYRIDSDVWNNLYLVVRNYYQLTII